VASRKAGDGPSRNVFIIINNSDEADPAGGLSRRIVLNRGASESREGHTLREIGIKSCLFKLLASKL
jgi:hypothetical protein